MRTAGQGATHPHVCSFCVLRRHISWVGQPSPLVLSCTPAGVRKPAISGLDRAFKVCACTGGGGMLREQLHEHG